MKALILAAGLGSRLAPITNDRPKSLVPVNGKPILMKQIENLHKNDIADITIVSGYKAEILEKSVHALWPEICIIESVNYATTNNMYSAYLGIKFMFKNGQFEPFIMMNADVFFDSSVLCGLLANNAQDAIAVDIGRYLEESMKVVEQDGRLTAISKQILPEDTLGCSIDVYKFSALGAEAFFKHCVDYIEKKKKMKMWSEVALNETLSDVVFKASPLNGRWFEIDSCEDLAVAERLFAE